MEQALTLTTTVDQGQGGQLIIPMAQDMDPAAT